VQLLENTYFMKLLTVGLCETIMFCFQFFRFY